MPRMPPGYPPAHSGDATVWPGGAPARLRGPDEADAAIGGGGGPHRCTGCELHAAQYPTTAQATATCVLPGPGGMRCGAVAARICAPGPANESARRRTGCVGGRRLAGPGSAAPQSGDRAHAEPVELAARPPARRSFLLDPPVADRGIPGIPAHVAIPAGLPRRGSAPPPRRAAARRLIALEPRPLGGPRRLHWRGCTASGITQARVRAPVALVGHRPYGKATGIAQARVRPSDFGARAAPVGVGRCGGRRGHDSRPRGLPGR